MSAFWVDVDNPPQAQYLSPIARELRRRGHEVLITARNHPPTLEVLANRGEVAVPVGGSFGASKASKVVGTLRRTVSLIGLVRRRIGRPVATVSTSRSGVLAARVLSSPSFTILDYEGVELGAFIKSGTTLLHPEAVPASRFVERGFPAGRLHSFPGLKEDIAFSGLDLDGSGEDSLPPPRDTSLAAVLVRPPSQTSHYRVEESLRALELVLDQLADETGIQVIFSPREDSQNQMIRSRNWRVQPVTLNQPVPLVSLLREVDHVITGGGTMLREAAWFGVSGSTVFQGPMPAVDEWLEAQGVIRRITPETDISGIEWQETGPSEQKIARHPETVHLVVDRIAAVD
jgi:predicted glycosyltransferase